MATKRVTRPAKRSSGAVAPAHPRSSSGPPELAQGLKDDPHARRAYEAMPPSHRKAYATFVEEAKRPETRVRRVQQALRMMSQWGEEHAGKLKKRTRKR